MTCMHGMIKTHSVKNIFYRVILREKGYKEMEIDYKQVFERMLRAGNFKNSSEMARMLGMTPQAISNHKKRGELSAGLIIRFAQKCNISVDWLLSGSGEVSVKAEAEPVNGVYAGVVVVDGQTAGRVEGSCYGGKDENGRIEREKTQESALLCPEEIIYVGKLLKILRSGQKTAPSALKASIDVIMGAVYPHTRPMG